MSESTKVASEVIKAAEENPTVDLTSFIPLGHKWLESMEKQAEVQMKVSEQRIEAEKWAYKHRFWLLSGIILGVFALSGGLIFIKNNESAGLMVISHVGAVVAGLLAGTGLERIKSK